MGTARGRMTFVVVAVLFAAACSSNGDDGVAARGDEGSAVRAEGDGGGDCNLLTDAEIEAATGVAPISHESPSIGRGCRWQDDADDISLVALEILDDEIVLDGEPASKFETTLERISSSSVEIDEIDGPGDRAAEAGRPVPNEVIVVDGETFVSLLVGDSGVVEEGAVIGLRQLVLERL